jgi:hypothetical protein
MENTVLKLHDYPIYYGTVRYQYARVAVPGLDSLYS